MDRSSRRGFLGLVASATALPLIYPPTSKGVPTRPSVLGGHAARATVFGASLSDDDEPDTFYPSLSVAKSGHIGKHHEIREYEAEFPGQWFFAVEARWDYYHELVEIAATLPDEAKRTVKRMMLDAGRTRQQVMNDIAAFKANPVPPKPSHELDLPPVIASSALEYLACTVLDREGVLRQVAASNRRYLALGSDWGGEWSIAMELSERLGRGTCSLTFAGEVAIEESEHHRAARVVRPTPVEIARYTTSTIIA
jgi:hypothetical protein